MCKCADNVKVKKSNGVQTFAAQDAPDEPMIRVQYEGGGGAKVSVFGKATGQGYGRRAHGDSFYIFEEDAMAQPGLFKPL